MSFNVWAVWAARAVMKVFFKSRYSTFEGGFSHVLMSKTNLKLECLYFVTSALKSWLQSTNAFLVQNRLKLFLDVSVKRRVALQTNCTKNWG